MRSLTLRKKKRCWSVDGGKGKCGMVFRALSNSSEGVGGRMNYITNVKTNGAGHGNLGNLVGMNPLMFYRRKILRMRLFKPSG
jgi:hypothetical protein